MGYHRNKLERGQYDIEWEYNKLSTSVVIPLRDKFKIRRIVEIEPLLFHIILKQGMTWFPLLVNDSQEAV